MILLSNCKYKSNIWIFGWTGWTNRRQPTPFKRIGRFSLMYMRIDCSGILMTRTADLETVQFKLRPGLEAIASNHCSLYDHQSLAHMWECFPPVRICQRISQQVGTDRPTRTDYIREVDWVHVQCGNLSLCINPKGSGWSRGRKQLIDQTALLWKNSWLITVIPVHIGTYCTNK